MRRYQHRDARVIPSDRVRQEPVGVFSEDGLAIGAGLEDLGKGLRSQIGTMYSTKVKGVRYLEMAEGYVTRIGLDEDNEVIGYEFIRVGQMLEQITAFQRSRQEDKSQSGIIGGKRYGYQI